MIAHRLKQIALALRRRAAPWVDPLWFPNDRVRLLFEDLHPHDQRHLIEVHQKARAAGLDAELCSAALLHDIGKVTLAGTRINLAARIGHVLLGRLAPGLRGSTLLERVPWLGTGLRLAERHGEYGAVRLRALGVSEDVCRVVSAHDHEGHSDARVRQLQEIDSATP